MSGWVGNSSVHTYDEAYWETTEAEDEIMSEGSEWTFEEPDTSDIPDWEDTDGDVWLKEGDRWCMYASPSGFTLGQPRWYYIPEELRLHYEWRELKEYGMLPFKPADNH